MQKQLFPSAWIFAALVLGIVACLTAIVWMLMQFPARGARLIADAQLVWGVLRHAAA